MKLLALDISSTNIGWVVLDGFHFQLSGTIVLKKGDLDARLRAGALGMYQLLTQTTPQLIAFEDAAYTARPLAMIAQQRMVGCLYANLTILNMQTPMIPIKPNTAKKALSGYGNAKKPEMMAAAKQWCGKALGEHEADALAVAVAALNTMRVAA